MGVSNSLFSISIGLLVILNVYSAAEYLAIARTRWFYLLNDLKIRSTLSRQIVPLLSIVLSLVLPISIVDKSEISLFVAICLFLLNLEMYNRRKFGQEGSDQVRFYLSAFIVIALIAKAMGYTYWQELYFCCSAALGGSFYFGAGIAKISNKEWWTGIELSQIMSTRLFGNLFVRNICIQRPALSGMVSCAIIIWELSIPMTMVLFGEYLIYLLIVGIIFHSLVAAFMRIPLFVISASAMYPSMYWMSLQEWQLLQF